MLEQAYWTKKIIRHFKGEYYFAETVATSEKDGFPNAVYTSLKTGATYIRPFCEFMDDVAGRVDNVTGQAHRFEIVQDWDNQLNLISTNKLVKELVKREDSPFVGLDATKEFEKVHAVEYALVRTLLYAGGYEGKEPIEVIGIFKTLDEARIALDKKFMSGASKDRFKIFKRIWVEEEVKWLNR